MGHVDEAGDVGGEHDGHVVFGDFGGAGDAFYQASVGAISVIEGKGRFVLEGIGNSRIVHQYIDLSKIVWKPIYEPVDFAGLADV